MVKLFNGGVIYKNGKLEDAPINLKSRLSGSIAYGVIKSHNIGLDNNLKIKFDEITSHDITYVGIIQTAKACTWKLFVTTRKPLELFTLAKISKIQT